MNIIRRNNRGAALVEFAIVALLLLTLVFGIIDFGWLIKEHLAIHQAAREGARTAAIGEITSAIRTRVIDSSPTTHLQSSNIDLEKKTTNEGSWGTLDDTTVDGVPVNDAVPGDYIRVTVRMQHQWLTGFFVASTPIKAEMTIRRE